jgi:hypothetical protein
MVRRRILHGMNTFESLLARPGFAEDYRKLAGVNLDPKRHTSENGLVHAIAVAQRARALGVANHRTEQECALLELLGHLHDLGKIGGTTHAADSVTLLERHGVTDVRLLDFVKYHDTNLAWFLAKRRGGAPGDAAWRKLSTRVDPELLALFMVADRVDCPGGYRENPPLMWFLEELRTRGLIGPGLVFDLEES